MTPAIHVEAEAFACGKLLELDPIPWTFLATLR